MQLSFLKNSALIMPLAGLLSLRGSSLLDYSVLTVVDGAFHQCHKTHVLKLRIKYQKKLRISPRCSSDGMDKNQKILSAVVLIVVIAVSGIFWFPAISRTLEPARAGPPTTNVEQISPQYLPGNVLLSTSNSSAAESFVSATRIFLVSATTYYGYSNGTRKSPNPAEGNIINKGDPIFIINVTLRNDYNSENPLTPSQDNHAFIFLTATLNSQSGTVNATDVSPTNAGAPPIGAFLGLNSGETASVEIWMATSNRNIDRYEINLSVFGIAPP